MSTYDERLAALEKDAATVKRDIIYKLDETNSAVTIIKGVVGNISHDVRIVNLRLDGIDTRMARLEEQQNEQGQDIKAVKYRLEDIDQRFTSLEGKIDGLEGRFDRLEKLITDRLPLYNKIAA